jgi:hypothetical protein
MEMRTFGRTHMRLSIRFGCGAALEGSLTRLRLEHRYLPLATCRTLSVSPPPFSVIALLLDDVARLLSDAIGKPVVYEALQRTKR